MSTVDILTRSVNGAALSHDEMDRNLVNLQNGSVPIGSVVAYAANIATGEVIDGWLRCDGSTLAQATYPKLYAVIGDSYDYNNNAGVGNFQIPDYRGYFLRGTDYGLGVDGDSATRAAPLGGVATDTGSIQPGALLSHNHYMFATAGTGAAISSNVDRYPLHLYNDGTSESYEIFGSTTAASAGLTGWVEDLYTGYNAFAQEISQEETRPINIYVTYLIKCDDLGLI